MSDYEHNKGKLIPVQMDVDLETTAKNILAERQKKKEDDYETFLEALKDIFYREYVVVGEQIYKISENKRNTDYYDIFNAHRNEDGTISYEVLFYNGGMSFGEAIGAAVKNIT